MKPSQIVQALIDAGLTQAEIADKTGLTQATVSRVGAGEIQNPRYDTVSRLIELKNQIDVQPSAA